MRKTNEFVFFWGDKDIYSNFYYAPFKHQDILFQTSEHAIMYRKAKLFGEHEVASRVLQAKTPKRAKELGRSIKAFDNETWEANREIIFKEVLLDKFKNSNLRHQIVQTGERQLVEASPFDKIWGIGLAQDHKDAETPSKWRGLNLLGKVLMEVRGELK